MRRILDYPNLWNYLKDLYQRPEFKVTCNLDYIKRGYYMSMTEINPNRIVPKGPIIDFEERHDRDRLGLASRDCYGTAEATSTGEFFAHLHRIHLK